MFLKNHIDCLLHLMLFALTVVLCGGCGGSADVANPLPGVGGGPNSASGIAGSVTRSPIRPAVQVGQVNTQPLPDAPITVYPCNSPRPSVSSSPDICVAVGTEVAVRTTSGTDGSFYVSLAPGRYVVYCETLGGNLLPRPPRNNDVVVVPANGYVAVALDYDTGIR